MEFGTVSRARAEQAVPVADCSGRVYAPDEREDIVRYVLLGAELQRVEGTVGGFSFVRNDVTNQTPDETLHVITYELGKVVESYHKSKRYGAAAYYSDANQQKEMSDLISMCRMYCEQRGWNFEELMKFGEEAYLERIDDLRKYGVKEGLSQ